MFYEINLYETITLQISDIKQKKKNSTLIRQKKMFFICFSIFLIFNFLSVRYTVLCDQSTFYECSNNFLFVFQFSVEKGSFLFYKL